MVGPRYPDAMTRTPDSRALSRILPLLAVVGVIVRVIDPGAP